MSALLHWHWLSSPYPLGCPSGFLLLASFGLLFGGLLLDVKLGVKRLMKTSIFSSKHSTIKDSIYVDRRKVTGTEENRTKRRVGVRGMSKVTQAFIVLTILSLILAIPLSMVSAVFISRRDNSYPRYTIGCSEGIYKVSKCSIESMVHVIAKMEMPDHTIRYRMQIANRAAFTTWFCPDYTPPYNPGDYAIYIQYYDHFNCWSLRAKDAGTAILRNLNNQTDSERINYERSR